MLKYLKCVWKTFFLGLSHLPLYAKRPHSLAYKQYGIRIVAVTRDNQQEEELCNGAYKALMLLEQHDREMFDRVKNTSELYVLAQRIGNASSVRTFRPLFVIGLRFPAGYSAKTLPITIAGFLVGKATLAKLKGCMAQDDKVEGPAILEICRRRDRLTKQKLQKAIRERKVL